MKTAPTVTVEVDTEGRVTIEVNGVQGSACLAITKELEDELGHLSSRKPKPECNAVDLSSSQQQNQSLGTSL